MKIFINGCSHSAIGDTEIVSTKNRLVPLQSLRQSWITKLSADLSIRNLYSKISSKPFFSKAYDGFRDVLESFLQINSDEFILTLAEDGKGNDSIFMDTMSTLYNFKKLNIKLDFVVVQWSGPSRRLVSGPESQVYQFSTPHEYFEYGVNLEPAGSFITINNMMILQNYLKDNNINYTFLNYFPLDKQLIDSYAFKELDLSKFLVYKKNHPIFDGWIDSIKKDGLSIDKHGHPNEDLQVIISNKVREQINLKKNLN